MLALQPFRQHKWWNDSKSITYSSQFTWLCFGSQDVSPAGGSNAARPTRWTRDSPTKNARAQSLRRIRLFGRRLAIPKSRLSRQNARQHNSRPANNNIVVYPQTTCSVTLYCPTVAFPALLNTVQWHKMIDAKANLTIFDNFVMIYKFMMKS